jgi:hypothetical protein
MKKNEENALLIFKICLLLIWKMENLSASLFSYLFFHYAFFSTWEEMPRVVVLFLKAFE